MASLAVQKSQANRNRRGAGPRNPNSLAVQKSQANRNTGFDRGPV